MIWVAWILVFCPSLSFAAPENEVQIRIESRKPVLTVRSIVLKIEKGDFRCRTSEVPWHTVKPKGLLNLNPPFSSSSEDLSPCDQVLYWGKAKTCLERDSTVESLFRWCENL